MVVGIFGHQMTDSCCFTLPNKVVVGWIRFAILVVMMVALHELF
uniref:Uncharacterized protein n=1 Tax=Arundo donax TaxID=35708 RepID=A0A0A9F0H1_ARUDO